MLELSQGLKGEGIEEAVLLKRRRKKKKKRLVEKKREMKWKLLID